MDLFNSIRVRKPGYSTFNNSFENKLTAQFGALVPVLCMDVIPGDYAKLRSEVFMRLMPLISPVMQRMNIYLHFFFVPNRLIWDDWEEFITGGEDGTSAPVPPYIAPGNLYALGRQSGVADTGVFNTPRLLDYMGVPTVNWMKSKNDIGDPSSGISALPFRAYALIYNEYYRDQNVDEPVVFNKTSGSVSLSELTNLYQLRYRAWEKDYFTSALPDPQRGPDVRLPISGSANVVFGNSSSALVSSGYFFPDVVSGPTNTSIGTLSNGYLTSLPGQGPGSPSIGHRLQPSDPGTDYKRAGLGLPSASVDLSSAQSTTLITDLRRAIKLQEFLEISARTGARYKEQLMGYFGVRSSDARLQRPEFLGGGVQPITIGDVMQTSATDFGTTAASATPQGNMAGYGISYGRKAGFKRFFEEHGWIIGIMSVRPKSSYMQGLSRMFTRTSRFDYYWPQFARIGEQEIKYKELFYESNVGSSTNVNEDTFGYAPRYAEYKFRADEFHGDFRDTLSFWHLGRIFKSSPELDSSFLHVNPVTQNRIFAIEDQGDLSSFDPLLFQIYHRLIVKRQMPKFGTPMI
ncbi:major capsid protein [Sigmofec virus UA08Rod_6151]|uniref:Major capsid protein n=1 Tax=Sigmofec virus UA08Rod_6151 TaxID=2929224 RepID=A0A976N118_9VIRU|nr:major capsid protein [Sigmofec virus UA08Rod_6151]